MKITWITCLFLVLFMGCKKQGDDKVDIYLLESFSTDVNQSGSVSFVSISNPVLSGKPLVADNDIEYYSKSQAVFKLKRDIRSVIKDFKGDKAFAVTVNNSPVYYGRFHPAYLSSLTIGVATVDPILFDGDLLHIGFVTINGNTFIQSLDKRNDEKIIKTFKSTGRLR